MDDRRKLVEQQDTWQIFIDVSGMPPGDIFVGTFLLKSTYKDKFRTEFYREFPKLLHYSKKSTKTKEEDLFEIIKFFNEKRLRMACYHFRDHQWKWHERRINELMQEIDEKHMYKSNFGGFKERIMGALYYNAITHIGLKSNKYDVFVCAESYADIMQVIDIVMKLAKRDNWNLRMFPVLRKHEEMLKMADYVAGANRKCDEFKLNTIPRHAILKNPISDFDLRKIFQVFK